MLYLTTMIIFGLWHGYFSHPSSWENVANNTTLTIMRFLQNIFHKTRYIFLYGLLLAILVFTLKWLQWKFLIVDNSLDIYIGLIAVFFTILGVWLATHLVKSKVKTVVVEKEVYVETSDENTINESELKKLNLSNREYEVLKLLAKGYSNADIAEALFVSISTVKSHVSNLFVKMDVKSRTQTLEKAKRLHIIWQTDSYFSIKMRKYIKPVLKYD